MKALIAMMLAAISLASCQSHSAPTLSLGGARRIAEDKMETITKKAGETFAIPLESNVTTGYSWALDGKEDFTVVRKVGHDYVSDPHLPGMVGYGGVEHWKFRAEKKGTVVLHFVYRRAWEKDIEPARERSFKVVVQ